MLHIRLLGQFDVRLDGKRVVISSRAGQSLLAYLALTAGVAHRREKLAGIFWPDTSEENARKNLRQELWRIRKAIPADPLKAAGEILVADEFTLTFNREADYWLDVAILEKPDLDPQSLSSNLSLYQGELLPGFYEDWVILERDRIQTVFESKMEQLVEQLVDAERWTAVQEQSERWIALGHAPEPAYRSLMLSFSARGDMAKVSSTYQRCVDDLQDQFGVEPSVETSALYNGLLKGAKAPRRVVPAQLSGTVTFLFTDIEGSTRLLDKLREQYVPSLAEHHKILRSAIQKWNGSEMDTQGDAFFVTFSRALDAVRCAAEAQLALARHIWPHDEPLRVRMGLHTGEPLIASTGYVGMDVHRAARIGDAGYGGQVLMSQTTRELVMHDLPLGLTIRDLGEHRLKDLQYPAPIYQLVIEGLPADFPPLKTRFTGTEAPTPGESPFKGLQYFDEQDADLFFGRELFTARLVNRLRESQFLSVIIGASGSGKSSLVRAGLIPALKKGSALIDGTMPPEGSGGWQIHTITPTAHPLEALAAEMTRDSESMTATATLMDDLQKEPRSLSLFLARKNHKQHTLLVVDQFEELFTLCRDEFEREAFIDNLLATFSPTPPQGEGSGRVTLVLTLRADFYAHLAQYPELRDAVAQQQEYIGPMTAEELRRAMEEPARRGNWEFEPGLVDLILRDVGDEPGALPLLSHALLETWKRRAGHTLTLKGYADAGGVRGAIAHTAESVYQNLSAKEQAVARTIFLRLTELGEGTEDTRRRASLEELMTSSGNAGLVRTVLNRLAEARLVTLSEGMAEVSHEALIREWPTLRDWLNQDRDSLHLHRDLTEAAQDWLAMDQEPEMLYRGARLAQAREWSAAHTDEMNSLEREYLEASFSWAEREAAEKELQRQRELENAQKLAEAEKQRASAESQRAELQAHLARQLRKRAVSLAGAFVLALLMAFAALFFGAQARQAASSAQDQQRVASSRELAAASISNLEVDPERSILLAMQAVTTTYMVDKTWTAEAEDALHRALQASRLELTLRGHTDAVTGVAYSPDGNRLASGSVDGTVKVWNAASGQELLTLATDTTQVHYGLAYSPDGKRLASTSDESTVKIWEATTGRELLTLRGHTDRVYNVAYSPDGTQLATTSEDRTVILWDAATGQLIHTLRGHNGKVSGIAFSPDGRRLATASEDRTVKMWDVQTGQELFTLSGHQRDVADVAFSPDGTRLATSSLDATAKLWDASTGKEILTLRGYTDWIIGIAFSPDGTRLATAGFDREVRIWDLTTGQTLLTLEGHMGSVLGLAFSPDGRRLATCSEDGTIKVWNVALSQELLTLDYPNAGVKGFSPDGTRLATGFEDGTVKIWDISTGLATAAPAVRGTLSLHSPKGAVNRTVFSPDGKRLAVASEDRTIQVWDAANGKELRTLRGHTAGVLSIAFRADGKRLASASEDYSVKVWDLEGANDQALLTLILRPQPSLVAFSPDGTRLATGSIDGVVKLWNIETGKETLVLRGHTDQVLGLAFIPDGKSLATASLDGKAIMWDLAAGKEKFTLSGHTAGIVSVAFSPDGNRLVTASLDGTAKIWDTATGQEQITLRNPEESLSDVVFSQDGSYLMTGSWNGTVRYYLLRIEDLMSLARRRVTRTLTIGECQQYLHLSLERCTQEYPPVVLAAPSPPEPGQTQSGDEKHRVCEVTDSLGVNDQLFNQIAYQGLQKAAEIFDWEPAFLESRLAVDVDKNLAQFTRLGCDLIVVPSGFSMADQVNAAAEANPGQKYQIMEGFYDAPLDNVWQQEYAVDQAGFLAGYVAASVTRTGKVGTFGGVNFKAVTDFMDGLALGVAYYNEKNDAAVEVLGWDVDKHDGLFTGNFDNTEDGRVLAEKLMEDGADILLPVAARVGLGAAAAVQKRGEAYIIGVDTDWTVTFPEYADIILTSIQKRLDVSVVSAVQSIEEGTFTGGEHLGTLENGGVSIAPFYNLDRLVSPRVKADLEQIEAEIIAGKIKTKP